MTRHAVYRHFDADNRLLYVGMAANPARRLSEHNSRSGWAALVATITVEWFDTRDEAVAAERAAIKRERPQHNKPPGAGARRKEKQSGPLAGYLRGRQITQSAFAQRLGINQATVSKLCSGKLPSFALAASIERATDGAVPLQAWSAA